MSIERTEKQKEASRINGAKSRGPVTDEGKRRSSRNALRHGRLASSFVLSLENEVEFRESLRELCDEHQPATPTEHRIVEAMAIAQWQQYRIMNAAAVAYDLRSETERQNPLRYKHHGAEILSNTVTGVFEDRPAITRMNAERSRLQRDYFAALNMLNKLKDRRDRKGGPSANTSLPPVTQSEEELETPEFEESTDCPEATTPIGLKNESHSAEIPTNSLQTNETPQVPFPPPDPMEARIASALLPSPNPLAARGKTGTGDFFRESTTEFKRLADGKMSLSPFCHGLLARAA